MDLTHEFTAGVPVERAWDVLTDLERIVPCLPGASIREVEGDEYRGALEVVLGAEPVRFEGTARFVALDRGARQAVLHVEGEERGGRGGEASATVHATLEPVAAGTTVRATIDLSLGGPVAELGDAEVGALGAELLERFVACLAADVLATAAASASPVPADPAPVGGSGVIQTTPGRPSLAGDDDTDAIPAVAAVDDPTDEIPVPATALGGAVAEPVSSSGPDPTRAVPEDRRGSALAVPVLGALVVLLWWRRRRRRAAGSRR